MMVYAKATQKVNGTTVEYRWERQEDGSVRVNAPGIAPFTAQDMQDARAIIASLYRKEA